MAPDKRAKEASWDDAFDPSWAQRVASWPWLDWNEGAPPREGWKKQGNCPRCGHEMTVYQEVVYMLDYDPSHLVPAHCNCGRPHAGRPDNDKFRGCGPGALIGAHR